jgi:hypothetical protein
MVLVFFDGRILQFTAKLGAFCDFNLKIPASFLQRALKIINFIPICSPTEKLLKRLSTGTA